MARSGRVAALDMGSAQLLSVIRQRCLAHISWGRGHPSMDHTCFDQRFSQVSLKIQLGEALGILVIHMGKKLVLRKGRVWKESKSDCLLLRYGKWVYTIYGSWNKILAWQSAVNSWGCYYPEWGKEETWFVGNYVDGAQLLPPAGKSRIIGIFCLAEKGL